MRDFESSSIVQLRGTTSKSTHNNHNILILSLINGEIEALDAKTGFTLWKLPSNKAAVTSWSSSGAPKLIPSLTGALYRSSLNLNHSLFQIDPSESILFRAENGIQQQTLMISKIETTARKIDIHTGFVYNEIDWNSNSDSSSIENETEINQELDSESIILSQTEVSVKLVELQSGKELANASLTHTTPSLVTNENCVIDFDDTLSSPVEVESELVAKIDAGLTLEIDLGRSSIRLLDAENEIVWKRALESIVLNAFSLDTSIAVSFSSDSVVSGDSKSVLVRQINGQDYVAALGTGMNSEERHDDEENDTIVYRIESSRNRESRPLAFPPVTQSSNEIALRKQSQRPSYFRFEGSQRIERVEKTSFLELFSAAMFGAAFVILPVAIIYTIRRRERGKSIENAVSSVEKMQHDSEQHQQRNLAHQLSMDVQKIDSLMSNHFVNDEKTETREQEDTFETSFLNRKKGKRRKNRQKNVFISETEQNLPRILGRISLSDEILGYGSRGTIVFKGTMIPEGRVVAVKRLLKEFYESARNEIAMLIELEHSGHNVMRYYAMHEDQQFIYLALEFCDGTLADRVFTFQPPALTQPGIIKRNTTRMTIPWRTRNALRDMMQGLNELHALGIVHRDLKPHNVFVAEKRIRRKGQEDAVEFVVKIGDVGLAARLENDRSSFTGTEMSMVGTVGWRAPEVLTDGRLTKSVDIFSAGCTLFYVLTCGEHPFGSNVFDRESRIIQGDFDLSLLKKMELLEAHDLVLNMIHSDPMNRPSIEMCLKHPFFWSDATRLSFLCDVSDRVQGEWGSKMMNWQVKRVLGDVSIYEEWPQHFDMKFLKCLGRGYGMNLLELLRLIRNKRSHYLELPVEVQLLVGALPNESIENENEQNYLRYFLHRFPNLIIHAYQLVHAYQTIFCFDNHFCRYGFNQIVSTTNQNQNESENTKTDSTQQNRKIIPHFYRYSQQELYALREYATELPLESKRIIELYRLSQKKYTE